MGRNINVIAGDGLFYEAALKAECIKEEEAAYEAATSVMFDEIGRHSREHLADIEAREAARKRAAEEAMRRAEVKVLKKAQYNTFVSLNCVCVAAASTAALLNLVDLMNAGGMATIIVMSTIFYVANGYAYGTRNRKSKKEAVISE